VGLVASPATSQPGRDDYPSQLRNAGRDAKVDPWLFYNRECTSFVAWRLNNDAGIDFHNWYDGHHWGDAAIWKKAAVDSDVPVDDTPRVGAIAWWAAGSAGSSRGHVAWVMDVNRNSITIEEYNYLQAGRYDTRTIAKTDDKWPTAFIHLGDLSLDNTTRPTITGEAQVGVELTAAAGTWTPTGSTFAFQWYAGGQPIDGATRRTFTPKPEQEGKRLRVVVTATKTGGLTGTATSAPTEATAPGELVVSTPPTVSGTPQVGVQLSATRGDWSKRATYAYQWRDSNGPIAGATRSTFTPTAAQVNRSLRVVVTATREGYRTAKAASDTTARARPGTFTTSVPPTVTGNAQVDQTLTASPGSWTPEATPAYQWLVDGEPVAGATGPTYSPRVDDVRKQVAVQVTMSAPGYDTAKVVSAATSAVVPGTFRNTSDASISGKARVDVTLTADPGGWSPQPSFSWQWLADGEPIPGATSRTYTPSPSQVGEKIAVEVTARRPGYLAAVVESPVTAGVLPGENSVVQRPEITGLPHVGTTLQASQGTWAVTPTSVTYQWYAGGVAVDGATSRRFTPSEAQLDQPLKVEVTALADGYESRTASSPATGPVVLGQAAFATGPSLSGTTLVGRTLKASAGAFTPSGATPSYQWLRGSDEIRGATGSTYELRPADVGQRVSVRVTLSAPHWESTSDVARSAVVQAVPELTVDVTGHATWATISLRVVTPGLADSDGRAKVYERGELLGTMVVTDHRGRLRIDGLSAGTHHLVLRYAGPGPQAEASTRFDVPIG
jgi:surface antigen